MLFIFDDTTMQNYRSARYSRAGSPGIRDRRANYRRVIRPSPRNALQRIRRAVAEYMGALGVLNFHQEEPLNA